MVKVVLALRAVAAGIWLSVFLAVATPALAGRVALVVGNSEYQNTEPLANPRNDAEAISAALRELGFEVFDGYDLTRAAFEDLVRDFARGAEDADAAVLYYAGHGLEVGNVNYLVPVDAAIRDETDLKFETITMADIVGLMERRQRTNLIFLDACRDNPMARNLSLSMGTRSVAVGRGLAPVETGIGTLIAYATQPGNVALDGEGRHSPFTEALLEHIGTPELDVEIMLRRVRRDVMQDTGGLQVPWSSSSLTGSFKFQPQPLQTPVPEVAPVVQTPVEEAIVDAGDETPAVVTEPEDDEKPLELASIAPGRSEVAQENVEVSPQTAPAPLSTRALALRTQAELNRLGCDAGVEDGIWGRKSRGALETLVEHAPGVQVAALEPSAALLQQIEKLEGRICPLVCAVTEDLVDGACVTKTCPAGQRLSSRGNCFVPQAATSRQRSSGGRSGSNCFTLNGETYCQ